MSVVADTSGLVMTRNLTRETVETVIRLKQFYVREVYLHVMFLNSNVVANVVSNRKVRHVVVTSAVRSVTLNLANFSEVAK